MLMRNYIAIGLLVIICAAGCADKDRQGTPSHEALTETTALQGMTEDAPEPSESFSEEPENPFISHFTDLLSEEEREELQNEALSAAESVRELCEGSVTADGTHSSSGASELENEQCKAAAELLGKAGLVSVAEDTDMQNPEKVEAFYADYLKGQDSMVTVFDLQRDGRIGAVTFIFRHEQLQTCCIGVEWKEDGTPEIESISINNVTGIKLTEKG